MFEGVLNSGDENNTTGFIESNTHGRILGNDRIVLVMKGQAALNKHKDKASARTKAIIIWFMHNYHPYK